MKKDQVFTLLSRAILVTIGFMLIFPFASGASEKTVIRVGHANPTDHIAGVELRKFKELVEKNSGGRIEIKVYDNSSLGKGKEMLEGVQLNTIEMTLLISQPPGLHPKLAIVELPWLFDDFAHYSSCLGGYDEQGFIMQPQQECHPLNL